MAWVQIADRKMLFVRARGENSFFIPGGKREAGETDVQALTREIKEELSVDLKPETMVLLDKYEAQASGKPEGVMVQISYYTAAYEGVLSAASEIEELVWLTSEGNGHIPATAQRLLTVLKNQNLID